MNWLAVCGSLVTEYLLQILRMSRVRTVAPILGLLASLIMLTANATPIVADTT